jgi:V/A-type H+-transporting ATPase subunit B
VRDLISIVGEDSLNLEQKALIKFSVGFEKEFLNQNTSENREITKTLEIAWNVLTNLPRENLIRVHKKFLDQYYKDIY